MTNASASASVKELPVPSFFDSANSRKWGYRPNIEKVIAAAAAYRKLHKVKPAGSAKMKITALGIDFNRDFCHPDGTLYVAGQSGTGGMDDSARYAEFTYRNAALITDMVFTMDTHWLYQIFFGLFWQNEHGEPLSSHTLIVVENGRLVNKGLDGKTLNDNVLPNPSVATMLGLDYTWLCKQVRFYCDELARVGKYTLYLWPPHCILGTDGHALVGVIAEAHAFFAALRGRQTLIEVKGGNPLTENYSVLRPEVLGRWDGKGALAQKNTAFISRIMDSDITIVGGEAGSHCLAATIEDLLSEILAKDPKLAERVYILEDCTSAVVVPGADFTPQMETSFKKFKDAGMHGVKSTDPIASWPGVNL